MKFNYGDIFDALADHVNPSRPAILSGDRMDTWKTFSDRTNQLARALMAEGHQPRAKVGFYMRNCPAYVEGMVGCFKARLTHVNLNYRYIEKELTYILDNSDAEVLLFAPEYAERVDRIRGSLPKLTTLVQVAGDPPQWAHSLEAMMAGQSANKLDIKRSPEDQLFLYTGGTTGMPKGVIWEHQGILNGAAAVLGTAAPETLSGLMDVIDPDSQTRHLPACPLMHGTGMFTAVGCMSMGGAEVVPEIAKFDAGRILAEVTRHDVTEMAIVGDAFCKPFVDELNANGSQYDLSKLQRMVSSGVMWSEPVKQAFLEHVPNCMLVDTFGASEGLGFGSSVTDQNGKAKTSIFNKGKNTKVFTEDFKEVNPGSDTLGFIAVSGTIPLGYYKDEVKSATVFKTIDGVRYSIPGDWCRVLDQDTIQLVGRGSVCINSAGEKIYPEEVEEAVKQHPQIEDCLVIGVPDPRFGNAVIAAIIPSAGPVDEGDVRTFCRDHLADYKIPKRIMASELPLRADNGKADYNGIKAHMLDVLGINANS